jgi:uncharacterized RDD family membrane protein YckC
MEEPTDAPPLPPPPPGPPPTPWAPPPSEPRTTGLEYGNVLRRVLAYWLDSFVVNVLAVVATLLAGVVLGGGGFGLVSLVSGVVGVGIHLLYFVGFWTGHARATPAMRLMKLQIGGAVDGATLTVQQGITRWVAFGGLFQALAVVPGLLRLVVLGSPVWALALLVSTMASPTRQGLHDRIAGSAVVQPVRASTPAMACLVLLVVGFVGLAAVAVVVELLRGGAGA